MVLENQSYVDYGMVLRVLEAEILGYEKQRRLKLNINWSLFTRQDDEGREVFDVCKAFEDYKEEGKQEMAIEMIRNLMKSQKVSFEIAANMLGLSKSSQKKIKTLI